MLCVSVRSSCRSSSALVQDEELQPVFAEERSQIKLPLNRLVKRCCSWFSSGPMTSQFITSCVWHSTRRDCPKKNYRFRIISAPTRASIIITGLPVVPGMASYIGVDVEFNVTAPDPDQRHPGWAHNEGSDFVASASTLQQFIAPHNGFASRTPCSVRPL